jgi:hypothetical protein
VVALHIRLNAETRGIVNARDLAAMKPDALIVNTSRADLIEAGALEAALRAGKPGFAAADVYEEEPVLGAAHPLIGLPNALCTPRLGYVEKDNYELYFGSAFDNVVAFCRRPARKHRQPGSAQGIARHRTQRHSSVPGLTGFAGAAPGLTINRDPGNVWRGKCSSKSALIGMEAFTQAIFQNEFV